ADGVKQQRCILFTIAGKTAVESRARREHSERRLVRWQANEPCPSITFCILLLPTEPRVSIGAGDADNAPLLTQPIPLLERRLRTVQQRADGFDRPNGIRQQRAKEPRIRLI